MLLKAVTSENVYKSTKHREFKGPIKGAADLRYANGNHVNNIWMEGLLRVYRTFDLYTERGLYEGVGVYRLLSQRLNVCLVTVQSKSLLLRSGHIFSLIRVVRSQDWSIINDNQGYITYELPTESRLGCFFSGLNVSGLSRQRVNTDVTICA